MFWCAGNLVLFYHERLNPKTAKVPLCCPGWGLWGLQHSRPHQPRHQVLRGVPHHAGHCQPKYGLLRQTKSGGFKNTSSLVFRYQYYLHLLQTNFLGPYVFFYFMYHMYGTIQSVYRISIGSVISGTLATGISNFGSNLFRTNTFLLYKEIYYSIYQKYVHGKSKFDQVITVSYLIVIILLFASMQVFLYSNFCMYKSCLISHVWRIYLGYLHTVYR